MLPSLGSLTVRVGPRMSPLPGAFIPLKFESEAQRFEAVPQGLSWRGLQRLQPHRAPESPTHPLLAPRDSSRQQCLHYTLAGRADIPPGRIVGRDSLPAELPQASFFLLSPRIYFMTYHIALLKNQLEV